VTISARASSRLGRRLALASAVVLTGLALAGFALADDEPPRDPDPAAVATPPTTTPAARPIPRDEQNAAPAAPAGPLPLVDGALDLRAGPVPVPISLHLPSLGIEAAVLGVGLNDQDVMDAPTGGLDDPVWNQAFWYRGSAVPGAPSTALIAGHVGSRGGPGVFARLGELAPGDPIIVEDLRTGVGSRYVVTESAEYTLEEAAQPELMARIYGAGPVAGQWPEPSADGLAHLTLVTCAGTFRGETHDHRRVVSAVEAP